MKITKYSISHYLEVTNINKHAPIIAYGYCSHASLQNSLKEVTLSRKKEDILILKMIMYPPNKSTRNKT